MKKKIKPYVISIAISLGVGIISALLTRGNMNIYEEVRTPPLSPPSFLFPVVWTVLYILMGISAAMIYTDKTASKRQKDSALYTYAASLFVNFFWSIIFFNMRAFLFAFIWLLLLLYLIISTILQYRRINPVAAYLQIPYALWVTFAGYLNFGIWFLNR
ncbi:MAG: tryptophan-rich sensory protein [Clostridia bacterium]|nr:tryptophan-rich sensory protein [Clostridia bacterium]